MKKPAKNDHPINELSKERWSPRAFSNRPVETRHASSLLEAARWAPSASNEQPWRFIIGMKGDETWDQIHSTLIGWNQQWADQAPVLLLVIGKEHTSRGRPNNWYAYDCGQAMAHISLEATNLGLFTHQMGGFSAEKISELFEIPQGYKPLAVMAVGYYGDPDTLPEEMKEREIASRERMGLKEMVFGGKFGKSYSWYSIIPLALMLIGSAFLQSGCNQSGRKSSSGDKSKPVIAADIPVFNADTAYRYVAAQVEFGPRVNNTEAHRQCAAFLVEEFAKYTPDVVVQSGTAIAFDGTSLEFQNIIASFGPSGNNRILLGAHWDSRPYADHDPDEANFYTAIDGANDGASGVGVLLEVARQLSLRPPPIGVDIILFDAEDYGPPEALQDNRNSGDFWGLGSQYWAKNPHQPDYYAKYGILLDMVGAAGATFLMEGFSMDNAPHVVKKVWDIGNLLGYSSYFLYQRGGYITDDHYYVIRDRGIPMIDIIHLDHRSETGMYEHWHTIDDNLDKIDTGTLKAVGQTVLALIYSEK